MTDRTVENKRTGRKARDAGALLLRTGGGRATEAKLAVLDLLEQTAGHAAAANVWERLRQDRPSLDLSTVYRSLTRLQQLGALHAVDVGGQLRYGRVRPHHQHAICTACSDVIDLPRLPMDILASDVAAIAGFTVCPELGVTVRGTCADCRQPGP